MSEWQDAPLGRNELAGYKAIFMKPPYLDWTAQETVDRLDEAGVRTTVLSLPNGVMARFTPEEAATAARRCNEFATQMSQDYPGRFGLFAMLPLPDVGLSLKELSFAFDQLQAVGIGLMTSYGDRWLGHPDFVPVLEELNRRGAIVHVHPKAPPSCANLLHSNPWAGSALLEFPFDTGRTILDLFQSGSLMKFRNIQWIFSHCGGVVPMLAGRMREVGPAFWQNYEEVAPNGFDHEMQRLYYDIACSAYSPTMKAFLDYIPPSQMLFGTDAPHISVEGTVADLAGLKLSAEINRAIYVDNARRLLSKLVE